MESLKIAISKGRILKESLPILAAVGIEPAEDLESSRKLIFETSQAGVQLIIVRATDVPTYVEYGAADAGVAGRDILMEYDGDGLYEPLDLGIARCRMVLAGLANAGQEHRHIRVATKYVNTTRRYFASQGRQVELIKLYGSMELAPVLGLADQIVDLVDTGNTLRANGLVELETICNISSRLIVNKASMKMKPDIIKTFVKKLAAVTAL